MQDCDASGMRHGLSSTGWHSRHRRPLRPSGAAPLRYGQALIAEAADRHGDLRIEVYQQNLEATLFYRACGFVPTGRRETDDLGRPFPLLIMECKIGECE